MTWISLLQKEVEKTGSIARVAAALDLSRSTVSQVLSGKYNADTRKVAERVLSIFGRVACPYLDEEISMETCRKYRERDVPMNHPSELRHWRVCYTCEAPENAIVGEEACMN